MITLDLISQIKPIISGNLPTTEKLKKGQWAYGLVDGSNRLFGNPTGDAIVEYTFTLTSDGGIEITPTIGGAKIALKISAKAGNLLKKEADGYFVDAGVIVPYEGENAIEIDKTTDPENYKVKFKINAADKILSQDANGLLSDIKVVKIDAPAEGYASQYKIVGKDGTTALGVTIDIFKDQSINNTEVINKATAADVTTAADRGVTIVKGNSYIAIEFILSGETTKWNYMDITGFIDIYTNGDGLKLVDNEFSVVIDPTSDAYISVGADGIKLTGIAEKFEELEGNMVKKVSDEETQVINSNIAVNKLALNGPGILDIASVSVPANIRRFKDMIPVVDMGNLYVYFDTSKKLDLNQLGNITVLLLKDSGGTSVCGFNLDGMPGRDIVTKFSYVDYERNVTQDIYDATTETWLISKIKINFDSAIISFSGGNNESSYIAAGLDTAMIVDSEIAINFGNEEYTQITKSSERPQTIINGETKNNMFLEDIQGIELVTTVEEI